MTGNLEMLMRMRKAKIQKEANVQTAEDIGKKAELGYFDVEFTMYGCAYWDRSAAQMTYRISSRAEDIYDYIESAARAAIYPGQVERLTLTCPVPLGTKELIAQDVKMELAKELREKYSQAFFAQLYELADQIQSDSSKDLLWEEAERLEGRFEEEALRQLEVLIVYAYSCKTIRTETYHDLLAWLAEERKSMDEDVCCKDIFEKTMYGIVYLEDGQRKYVSNAQRDYIYKKTYALETQGVFVSPFYAKTYWYNYEYRLSDVKRDYNAELKQVYDQAYIQKLTRLKGKADPAVQQTFARKLKAAEERYGTSAAQTMQRYGYRWGVL